MSEENITDQEQEYFDARMWEPAITINYREVKLESYYQELKEKISLDEDEAFIFPILEHIRECYEELEKEYSERCKKISGILKKYAHIPRYCDWDSRPILHWEYAFKSQYFPKHVAEEIIEGYRVSTVWLGLNHASFSAKKPIIFETMIFPEEDAAIPLDEIESFQERYSTLAEAERGHKAACRYVKKLLHKARKELNGI
jgi:hypothetical protein